MGPSTHLGRAIPGEGVAAREIASKVEMSRKRRTISRRAGGPEKVLMGK